MRSLPDGVKELDLKSAVRFRRFADTTALKVFDRVLVKFYDAPTLPPLPFLDAHQLEGVKWILTRSRSYLAHPPGAGKTAEAIVAAICSLKSQNDQVLFVVPPGLTTNWARELIKFTEWSEMWPTVTVVPLTNKKSNIEWRSQFILCPDSMLSKKWVQRGLLSRKFVFVGVDEGSRFKEETSDRTKGLFGGKLHGEIFPGLIQSARHAVLMDGTPMPNRPIELWAPVYAMAPEIIDFMERADFGMRYCGPTVNDYGRYEFKHSSNEAELKERLQKTFMHVVPESALKHPERRRSIIFMDQDPRTPEHVSWEEKHLSDFNFDDIGEDLSNGDIARYRRELGLAKVPWITNFISDILERKNESILLFAWHRDVCTRLELALRYFKPLLVMGGLKNETREAYFKLFQSRKSKLLIGNIKAMGVGHNLQAASRVCFGEYSWSDALNRQCEHRAARKGSAQIWIPCNYIVAPNTMDEPILASVFRKRKIEQRVIG